MLLLAEVRDHLAVLSRVQTWPSCCKLNTSSNEIKENYTYLSNVPFHKVNLTYAPELLFKHVNLQTRSTEQCHCSEFKWWTVPALITQGIQIERQSNVKMSFYAIISLMLMQSGEKKKHELKYKIGFSNGKDELFLIPYSLALCDLRLFTLTWV